MTPQEKADKLEAMIQAEIDAGRFRLSDGYLNRVGPNSCEGCALAAAALAIGNGPVFKQVTGGSSQYWSSRECVRVASEMLSLEEAAQLEMGYELWTQTNAGSNSYVVADAESPFFKLGNKLGASVNHGNAYAGPEWRPRILARIKGMNRPPEAI